MEQPLLVGLADWIQQCNLYFSLSKLVPQTTEPGTK